MSNSGDTFDYIIIGGGSSGSILTNRLSSNGSTVCLIEAGPKDTNPYIHIPAGYIKNIFSKKLTWNFFSEPSPHTNSSIIFFTTRSRSWWIKLNKRPELR